ncbi:glycerol-3-phosphate acyltransferase 3 isoform X2 [Lepeophtheirus salmonis]|uniref:glycerol-3-phosphate acyltransferase 3 isoform X2 n=1 Tax=Lepeophtheirus salmonis TaxID=72036 RepID=UPI001AE24630|nr:glycerol-3-phosphate acyltransferase 3-like isoform X4 [Lepeophtheirus salmonis]
MLGTFLIVVVSTLLFLAIFGKSLGTRRVYVKALLQVFEVARNITTAHREELHRQTKFTLGADSDEEEEEESDDDVDQKTLPAKNLNKNHFIKPNGVAANTVISRKGNLILNPDGSSASIAILEKDSNSNRGPSEFIEIRRNLSANTFQIEFELVDVLDYVKTGIASIIEDEVTKRFVAEELKTWNLLTRTSQSFEFINLKLTIIWILGFFVRYFVLLPGRLFIFFIALINMCLCMFLIGLIPDSEFKKTLHSHTYTNCFELLGGAVSAVITYHNPENMPKGGICVANHTSPLDVLILACNNAYALIGQRHGGLMGFVQNILGKASSHIWFEREVSKDRLIVVKRLSEHVNDSKKLPILIFPEGTCINNTSVMQFKKGSFEVGGQIYPVAIKYDPLFGDAFWNSSKHGMLHYIFRMMTSWAIVCDVWYLPPMSKRANEDAISFANRVKRNIAKQGGLVDLVWDGNLKRNEVKSEWKAKQQEDFSKRFKFD